jgi:superfamily II DNA or RNA helicase
MKLNLRDYQQKIINTQLQLHSSLIIAKMGCGKTSATLMTIKLLAEKTKNFNVLITAPLSVAKNVWGQEIEKWDDFKNLDYAIAVGTAAQRQKAIDLRKTITIINHDNLAKIKRFNYDLIVIDESSCFKNASSKRFKALKNVKTRFTLLTGTPVPNSYIELWSQMFLVDRGATLERTITNYKTKYFDYNAYTYELKLKPNAKKYIQKLVKKSCCVVESYKALPKVSYVTNYAELNKQTLQKYNDFKTDLVSEIDDTVLTAANAVVLVNKLLQFSSGAVYDREKNVIAIHDEKLKLLTELIELNANENIIIAYNFQHEKTRIVEQFPNAVDVREPDAVERWNNNKIKILLCHPKSAGHGLNLQNGGFRIFWFGLTWSNELREQMNARILRTGQKNACFIHTLIVKNTIEEKLVQTTDDKATNQIDLIRNLLTR